MSNQEETKQPTIYVVTSGDYSDYHIDGVFTDKAMAELFAKKDYDRNIEEFTANDECLMQPEWYWVGIPMCENGEELSVEIQCTAYDGRYFDAVKYEVYGGKPCLYFGLRADSIAQAKTIAMERYHALRAVEQTHFPLLRFTRRRVYEYFTIEEALTFGYYDHKAYWTPSATEHLQDLFQKVLPYLPKPLSELEEKAIDWTAITEDDCLLIMKEHGLDVVVRDKSKH